MLSLQRGPDAMEFLEIEYPERQALSQEQVCLCLPFSYDAKCLATTHWRASAFNAIVELESEESKERECVCALLFKDKHYHCLSSPPWVLSLHQGVVARGPHVKFQRLLQGT